MLVMSDASGPGIAQTGVSYLTGYPLQEAGLYALSKTWSAPEMPRPGCVWTHTLLIGFTDLAALDAPSLLTQLFQRPSLHDLETFSGELTFDLNSSVQQPFSVNEAEWFAVLATALYEHPLEQIWARRTPDIDADDLVLRLWDQQWPRLRRSFKFCTLTTRDRSQESIQFDLQLTPLGETNARLRFASTIDGYEATTISDASWLKDLVRDAEQPHKTSLRQILRRLGVDILGGRDAMRPICELHTVIDTPRQIDISKAIALVLSVSPLSNSELAKALVVRCALNTNEFLTAQALTFVLDNLSILSNEELLAYAPVLANGMWQHNPRTFIDLSYHGNAQLQAALRTGAKSIDEELVIQALPQVTDLVKPLLEIRPELVAESQFWAITQAWPSAIAVESSDLAKVTVVHAMIQGLHDEGAINSALRVVRVPFVLTCVQELQDQKNAKHEMSSMQRWIRFACHDAEGVAAFLTQVSAPSYEMLRAITNEMPPDAVPDDYGVDPWLIALSKLRTTEGKLPQDLCAYGFRRALGWRSKSIEQLLTLTFESLHNAALNDTVLQSSWDLLEGALPWVPRRKALDKALRLRQAVAKKCVDELISPEGFLSLASTEVLLISICDEVWEVWGGRSYLKQLDSDLQHSSRSTALRRSIRDYLKRRSNFW